MKVNVIFLDYHRHDFTARVKDRNFNNAGYPFDHVVIDMKGVSAALNAGIRQSLHYDAVVTMANDILMPDGWLSAMVQAAEAIPNTGMAGVHTVEAFPPSEIINGVRVHPNYTAFGNVLIPISAIRKVGFFNLDFDPYSMNDADYALRLNETGHINYYVNDLHADHIGADTGTGSEYRKMKDEGLSTGLQKFNFWADYYRKNNNYCLDFDQDFIINQTEWPSIST